MTKTDLCNILGVETPPQSPEILQHGVICIGDLEIYPDNRFWFYPTLDGWNLGHWMNDEQWIAAKEFIKTVAFSE